MSKKKSDQMDLEQAIEKSVAQTDRMLEARAAYLHNRKREEIEFREENPRDIVALMPNSDGEIVGRRVPLRALYLDENGHEVLDDVPVAPPVTRRPLSTFEQIQLYNERQRKLQDWPDATLEEEDNFDIPDDPMDPSSQWEETFEVASIDEVFRRARQIVADRKKAAQEEAPKPPSDGPRTPAKRTVATHPSEDKEPPEAR